MVELSKRKAGNLYLEAGRAARPDADHGGVGPVGKGGFTKLTGASQRTAFLELGDRPTTPDDWELQEMAEGKTQEQAMKSRLALYDQMKGMRETGAALGLSPAEFAAINTFTAEDYRYINPATANSLSWMRTMNEDLVDETVLSKEEAAMLADQLKASPDISIEQRLADRDADLATRKEEGSLHAGMALQGLLKLPVWKGTLYRGEALDQDDFDARFRDNGKLRA